MIDIKVYGPGCKRCKKAFEAIQKIVSQEYADDVRVEKIEDFERMLEAKIMSSPTISINGTILSSGKVPKAKQIREWIEEALRR